MKNSNFIYGITQGMKDSKLAFHIVDQPEQEKLKVLKTPGSIPREDIFI